MVEAIELGDLNINDPKAVKEAIEALADNIVNSVALGEEFTKWIHWIAHSCVNNYVELIKLSQKVDTLFEKSEGYEEAFSHIKRIIGLRKPKKPRRR